MQNPGWAIDRGDAQLALTEAQKRFHSRTANQLAYANVLALDFMDDSSNRRHRADTAPDADLGRRERQIMEILYRVEPLSVSNVLAQLPDPPSYSAVRTMLGLLERKGYVVHEEQGRAFYYRPKHPQKAIRNRALRHFLKTFFNDSTTDLVAALVDPARRVSDSELGRLAILIEEARKEGR